MFFVRDKNLNLNFSIGYVIINLITAVLEKAPMNSQEAIIMGKKPLMSIFRDNEVMLREGDTTEEMLKILSGKAALYLNFGKENEYFIGVLSEGKCFGEVSLLAGKPSPYTVVAVG